MVVENRSVIVCSGLLWMFCISYEMCDNFFYEGKKKQRGARVKRKTKQWKKAIPWTEYHSQFFLNKHLLQICYVTYFCARNLNEILFFKAILVVIVPVLFNSGTLCLWLQPAEVKPSRDASFCIIQTSPSLY